MVSVVEILNIALENVVIGVVAAGLVGLGSYTVNEVRNRIIERRFQIEGNYITEFEDERNGEQISRKAPAELKQTGRKVTGTTRLPETDTKEWEIRGEIHEDDQYINGIYRANNPRDEGVGNFFLYINSDGSMDGLWSGYDDENEKINSGKYRFQPELEEFTVRELNESDIPSVVGILDRQIGRDYVSVDLLRQSIDPDSSLFTLAAVAEDDSLSRPYRIAARLLPGTPAHDQPSSPTIQSQETDIIGFCIGATFDMESLVEYLNISASDLPEGFHVASKIGVVRTIAVKEAFQGQGIGTKLVSECIERCSDEGATVLCSVGWKEDGSVNIGGIMDHFGFNSEMEIDEYWHEESLERGYRCSDCGEPPCTCTAVLFARYIGR